MGLRPWYRARCRRGLLAVGWLAALLPAVAASHADAAWTAPINLSSSGQTALQPQVAAGETGAVFTWALAGPEGQAQTRARPWGGVLSPTQDLSVHGADPGEVSFDPDVAVGDLGAAVYAWGRYTQQGGAAPRVQARTRSAGGTLGPIHTLSPILGGLDNIHVAANSDGDAVVVWEADMGTFHQIQARTVSAAGAVGPRLQLSAAGQDATRPQVAVDAEGGAVFAWQRLDGTTFRADARALSAAGVLEPTTQLSSSRWTSTTPQVAVDPAGKALFVWRSTDPGGAGGGRIETRARLAGGSYTRRQTVADAPGDASDPQVAIADDGAGIYAWWRSSGLHQSLKVRPRSALGGLGTEQTVKGVTAPQTLSPPRLAVDADGDAVIAWELFDARASEPPCCSLAQARTRSSGGSFGPVQTLSPPGAGSVEVAGNANGDAAVVWTRSTGGVSRAQASAGP